MCWYQSFSISFFDAVISATMYARPGASVKMLYNLEGPLVGSRRKWRGEVNVKDLEYGDDMTLVSDSMDALEEMLRTLSGLYVGMGLTVNARKTKILAVHPVS